jgi:hypothetical protein
MVLSNFSLVKFSYFSKKATFYYRGSAL